MCLTKNKKQTIQYNSIEWIFRQLVALTREIGIISGQYKFRKNRGMTN